MEGSDGLTDEERKKIAGVISELEENYGRGRMTVTSMFAISFAAAMAAHMVMLRQDEEDNWRDPRGGPRG